MLSRVLAGAILLALPFLPALAPAASFNWGTPQDITGDTDVSLNGNLIGAFNVGDIGVPGTTVNGVLFQSFAAPGGNGTVGNFTTTSGFSFASNTGAGSPNPPFTALSAPYQSLLESRVAVLSSLTLTISGLMIGTQYEFQFWTSNSSDDNSYDTTATAGTSVTVFSNQQGVEGGLGQFAIGSFTADAATQMIDFSGVEVAFLNAFQLREIPAGNGVPESGSTLALLGLVATGLAFVQRRLRCGA
jgi:hypothetical protein